MLGRPVRRARCGVVRASPMYPPEFWSVVDRVELHLPATNNFLESWHRRLKELIVRDHPSFYAALKQFQYEQRHTEGNILRIEAGDKLRSESRESAQRKNRIQHLMSVREERPLHEYLRGIAHNFSLDFQFVNDMEIQASTEPPPLSESLGSFEPPPLSESLGSRGPPPLSE